MKFTLKIDSVNDAFEGDGEYEVARILRQIADQVENGVGAAAAMDLMGNSVGHWEVSV